MSSREKPGTAGKQPKSGKQKQAWTERAVARAGRACPDRVIRILRDGVIELVPITSKPGGASGSHDAETGANDLDRELAEFRARHGQG